MVRKITAACVAIFTVALALAANSLWENVEPDEIVAIQAPISGEITWYTSPGLKWQGLGKVFVFEKRNIYEFANKIRFNDGAHAVMKGSIQYEMPLDIQNLGDILARFGSQEAVQTQLVKTVVDKATYMTGPLMSSKESYAEKRNSLIWYVEDQVANGVYKTTQRDIRTRDEITGMEKTVTLVELVTDKNGVIRRQEDAVLTGFGIKPFNFSISDLPYDSDVEQQIKDQQAAVMAVQTALAESRKAEQDALTTEKRGQAEAAKAKWQQEAIKAQAVTLAMQEKEVAETDAARALEVQRLAAETAEQYRIEQIRRAEADATYKKKVMEADGALAQKLKTYEMVQARWAEAFANYRGSVVPKVQMGASGSSNGVNGVSDLIAMLSAKTAQDLALDLTLPAKE